MDKPGGPLRFATILGQEYREVLKDRGSPPPAEDDTGTLYRYAHNLPDGAAITGLCISGGGIRSATFGLGVLQGLARKGLLGRFDYLSTVSGGGYIGSWLKAWQKNDPTGYQNCLQDGGPSDPERPEPPPLRHLRSYSNYLSPKLGLFSGDSWTLIAIYLRNLLLNWIVLLPVLLAAALLPWMGVGFLSFLRGEAQAGVWTFAVGFGFGTVALGTIGRFLPSVAGVEPGRRWLALDVMMLYGIPLLISIVCLTFSWFNLQTRFPPEEPTRLQVLYAAAFGFHAVGFLMGAWRPSVWRWRLLLGVLSAGVVLGILLWFFDRAWVQSHGDDPIAYFTFAVPAVFAAELIAGAVMVGIYSTPPATETVDLFEDDREWWGRAGALGLMAIFGWLLVAIAILYVPQWLLGIELWWQGWITAAGSSSLAGVLGAVYAWWGQSSVEDRPTPDMGRWEKLIRQIAEKLLGPLFLLGVATGLSLIIAWRLNHFEAFDQIRFLLLCSNTDFIWLSWRWLVLLGASFGAGYFVSANRFSMQSLYRNRLIRAYLGASRTRRPNLFTGFDREDSYLMTELSRMKPFHIVNMALNITGGTKLAWQQRQAASFTATRLHCGSAALRNLYGAYWPSGDYTDAGGLSVGTAVAISGAAASPNMGYHSSKVLSLLMSLFNIRLGMWLPNPASPDPKHVRKADPVFPYMVVAEALGLTDDEHPWVYLSDGGHFENLGLYELVRRRCRYIVISDGSADPEYKFEDVANAIQKVRVDLGIPIRFSVAPRVGATDSERKHGALLMIDYSAVDGSTAKPGWILYLKGVITGDEDQDVRYYHDKHPLFPQEPTSDQFFDEAQFEAYHRLGQHAVDSAFAGWDPEDGGGMGEAMRLARDTYLG